MGEEKNNQLVGNTGLFYICYELSKRWWNCLPTTRNAKGIDIVIYSRDGTKKHTIQVKSLSRKSPVPFGSNPNLMADFIIICRNVFKDKPEVFIMTPGEVKSKLHEGIRKGKKSYWLQEKSYKIHENRWDKIGKGF